MNWIRLNPGKNHHPRTHANPRSERRSTSTRLDASGQEALARRHLRPNPGSDVAARQLEYRADMSVSGGEPGGFLPVFAGAEAGRRGDGSAVGDSANCA